MVGRLVGERIAALDRGALVSAGRGPGGTDAPVGGECFVRAVTVREDHVDDRLEARVEQHVERGVDVGAVRVGDLVRNRARRVGSEGHGRQR